MPKKPPRKDFWQELTELIEDTDLPDIQKRLMQKRWLDQVKWLEGKANKCQRRYYSLRVTTILGGVIVPAMIGINTRPSQLERVLNWVAFGLAQGVAVSAAVEELFHYGDRYRRYRNSAEIMKIEGWQFLQLSGHYKSAKTHAEAYRDFAYQVENIIREDVEGYTAELVKEKEQTDAMAAEAVKGVTGMQSTLKERITYLSPPPPAPPASEPELVLNESENDGFASVESIESVPAPKPTPRPAIVAPAKARLTVKTATLAGTFLKASTQQSNDLPEEQKHWLSNGTRLDLQSYKSVDNHYMLVPCESLKGIPTWFAFCDHVVIESLEKPPPAPAPVQTMQEIASPNSLYCGSSGKIPKCGIELVKKFEGWKPNAYKDPRTGGLPITIGWGTTKKKDGSPWHLGDRITQEEAEELLYLHLEKEYLPALEKIPCWGELNANQRGALLSFAYNLGAGFYGHHDFQKITRVLRDRHWNEIKKTFVMYRNPGTNVEKGLRARREAEARLFLTPVNGNVAIKPATSATDKTASKPQVGGTTTGSVGTNKWVQEKLVGFCILDPPADGKWGKQSQAALAWFQQFKGLADRSGKFTPETIEALKNTRELIPLKLGSDFASRIARFMTRKGYYLPRGDRRYSIVYVQSVNENFQLTSNTPDAWDDRRIVLEVNNKGVPRIVNHWVATCDPGRHYTLSPMNPGGAAQVAFGQYKAWQHGLHTGYPALVQVGAVDIYRDSNKSFKRDTALIKASTGNGINQHHGGNAAKVGRYSAGCLVGKNVKGHEEFLALCKQDIRYQVNAGYIYWTTVIEGTELFRAEYA
ncbi:MAG: DUF4231 domain-containing protein [Cyanobacteriota bacterium]|nr:DUF4231 domain-containing protein [Cyanobacteriota bacterium]